MRSMLVIGLGRFGRHLAIKLVELGNEVMVVDTDEDAIIELPPLNQRFEAGDSDSWNRTFLFAKSLGFKFPPVIQGPLIRWILIAQATVILAGWFKHPLSLHPATGMGTTCLS